MKPIVLIGYGGHAKVIESIISKVEGEEIIGYTDLNQQDTTLEWFGTDEIFLTKFDPEEINLVMGIGYTPRTNLRKRIFSFYSKKGYSFRTVIHPSAILASDCIVFEEGVQIMAGAIIQNGVVIGRNSLINSGAIIEHDVVLKEHIHIAPGAVLCGGVRIEDEVYIGASSTVLQLLRIGKNSVVAAGAVLNKSICSDVTVMGIPARVKDESQ